MACSTLAAEASSSCRVSVIDHVVSGPEAPAAVGNCLPLSSIPPGMDVHNIEMLPGRGGVLCRSAGIRATLAARDADWAQINPSPVYQADARTAYQEPARGVSTFERPNQTPVIQNNYDRSRPSIH